LSPEDTSPAAIEGQTPGSDHRRPQPDGALRKSAFSQRRASLVAVCLFQNSPGRTVGDYDRFRKHLGDEKAVANNEDVISWATLRRNALPRALKI
jgi:hypothetical protein